jgi:hypothetical protein
MRRGGIALAAVWLLIGVGPAAAFDIEFRDDLPGQFIDISQTGKALMLGDDDEVELNTIIRNDVFPGGRIVIGNNGGMSYDPPGLDLDPENQEIPSGGAFAGGQALLAFWDDIEDKEGDVYFEEKVDRLIIQWHDRNFKQSGDTSRFQIQVMNIEAGPRRGPLVFAQLLYDDIEQPRAGGGVSATIGYQDGGAGFMDLQFSFNQFGAVSNGTVLTVSEVPEPSTLVLVALAGAASLRRRKRS